jgi:hypothetical protein
VGPSLLPLARPSNAAERAALDTFVPPAGAAACTAFDALRRRGALLPRISYRAGIIRPYGRAGAVEVALLVEVHADPHCERILHEERRLVDALRDQLIHQGQLVGDIPAGNAQLFVRGPAVAVQASEEAA